MMLWKLMFCLTALIFVHGVTTPNKKPNYAALQTKLDTNRALWESSVGCQYSMTLSRQCYCIPEYRGPFDMHVVNGEIVSVDPDNDYTDDLPTVEGLFDIIQGAIDDRVQRLSVSYDSQYGFPTSVYIDVSEMIADEEIGYSVDVTLSNESCSSCGDGLDYSYVYKTSKKSFKNGFNKAKFVQAIKRWEAYLESVNCAYRYKLIRSCFCLSPDFTGPFVIDVKNGKVVEADFETPAPFSQVPDNLPTITELFKKIFDEAQDADKVDIEYDAYTGVPTQAFFDRIEDAIDDEITYLAELIL